MEKSTQLSIAMENVPGQLGRLCRIMTQTKVNIRGISIAEAADLSIIRLLVSDPEAAKRALRNAGVNFVAQQVIVLDLEDRPGGLEFVAGRLGDAGINVNTIAPGYTETDFLKENPQDPPEMTKMVVGSRCIKRPETPEDLTGTIVFLSSDDSDFITGQTIIVDGGSALN